MATSQYSHALTGHSMHYSTPKPVLQSLFVETGGILKKRTKLSLGPECWHYLSSRQVTLQVLSAQMSLTSVFGMGTGGPSSQSIPTLVDGFPHHLCQSTLCSNSFAILPHSVAPVKLFLPKLGDPYRIRTDVKGVRGLCLNHLTNGPFGAPSRTRTGDPLIKSQLLYQLS